MEKKHGIEIEGAFIGISVSVKEKLRTLLGSIKENEGKRIPEYSQLTNFSIKSLERYIGILKELDMIEFKGKAHQTGGVLYYPEMEAQIIKTIRIIVN